MEEVLGVAVLQRLHELPGETLNMLLREVDHAGVQQPPQVVVTVLKHQVEGSWRTHRDQGSSNEG